MLLSSYEQSDSESINILSSCWFTNNHQNIFKNQQVDGVFVQKFSSKEICLYLNFLGFLDFFFDASFNYFQSFLFDRSFKKVISV